jgi:pyruvate,water dikinase
MKLFYRLAPVPSPPIGEVGGKGQSLFILAEAGLPVPNGFVLTVAFFEPWIALLKATPAWKRFLSAVNSGPPQPPDPADFQDTCRRLKDLSAGYELTADQKKAFREGMSAFSEKTLFAVRSSSPEEDLGTASFAGGYETVLGAAPNRLEASLHIAFASCLDTRVVTYKRARGFDPTQPAIAVIVQEQVAGTVSGVGFSLNPLTGKTDEAVFESNWGLGQSVAAGRATPDHFVVEKPTRKILERRVGRKERSVVLLESGGTHEREDPRHDQLSLEDGQVQALTEALIAIERRYGRPIDMEWAFAGGHLFMLQARPIVSPTKRPAERPGAFRKVVDRIKAMFQT